MWKQREPKTYNRKLNQLTNSLHMDIGFSTLKYPYFNMVYEDFYVKLNKKQKSKLYLEIVLVKLLPFL